MRLFLIQIIFVVSWSSGFIGARIGTQDADAINLLFWRFLLVVIFLLPFLWGRTGSFTWEKLRYNGIIGLLSQFVYLVSIYIAISNGLPAGIAAVIAAMQPLITAALSVGGHFEKSTMQEWLGLTMGFIGVAIVIAGEYAWSGSTIGLGYYMLPLAAALSLTIATLYQRRQSLFSTDHSKDGLLLPLFLQSCASLMMLGLSGQGFGTLAVPSQTSVWIAVIWLTLFSTFVAYLGLWYLLTKMSATRVAALVYLEPPVTLMWAAWMFGDVIHWTSYIGMSVIAAGILIERRQRQAQTAGSLL